MAGSLPIAKIKKISKLVEEKGVEEARKELISSGMITRKEIKENQEKANARETNPSFTGSSWRDPLNQTKDSLKYIGKSLGLGTLGSVTGTLNAPLQELENDLEQGKEANQFLTSADALLSINPLYNATKSSIKSIKKGIEVAKDKNKNTLEKVVDFGTSTLSDTFKSAIPLKNTVSDQIKFLSSINPEKTDDIIEKVQNVNDTISTPYNNLSEHIAEESQKQDSVTQTIGNVVGVIGNMAPSIALSAATGNPAIGLSQMGMSVKGQATEEALQNGQNLNKAIEIGDTKAMIEVGTELLTGGIPILGKGALDDIVTKGIDSKVKNKVINYLAKQGIGVGGEVLEETVSDVLNTAIDKGTVDLNASYSLEDWGDTALTTVLSTVVLNALTGNYTPAAFRENAESINNSSNIEQNITQENYAELPPNTNFNTNQNLSNIYENNSNNTNSNQNTTNLGNIISNQNITNSNYIDELTSKINNILPEESKIKMEYAELPNKINSKYANDTITLNKSNITTENLGHELTHHLMQQKGYENLSDHILTELDKSGQLESMKQEVINTYAPVYNQENRVLTDSDVEAEIVAKYSEKLFSDKETINRLTQSNRNLVQKVYDWVVDKINYYKTVKNMSVEQRQEYDTLRKAEKLYRKAMESEKAPQIVTDFQTNINQVAENNFNVVETASSSSNKQQIIDIINSNKNFDSSMKQNLINGVQQINNLDNNTYNNFLNQIEEINQEYNTFATSKKEAKVKYNSKIVEEATNTVPSNKQGKRTKAEWLKVAEQIGINVENKAELQQYAEKSWSQLHPNIADNLNRQGKKYVKFTKEEWINAVTKNNNDRYSIVGTKAAENEQTNTLKNKYVQALNMEKIGIDNETIRKATNWFKDKNGAWKFEISDKYMELKNIKLKAGNTYKLGEILKHDTLFNIYPELSDYNVEFKKIKAQGSFFEEEKKITINSNKLGNKKSISGTLIHEIQHAIQNIENFESGMNGFLSKKAYYESLGEIEANDTKKRFLLEKKGDLDRYEVAPESSKENPKHTNYDNYMKNRKSIDKLKDKVYNYIKDKVNINERSIKEVREYNNDTDSENVSETRKIDRKNLGDRVATSTQDNKGRSLSREQQEYFKDSKVRDEDGNLLTMYHGTPNGNHTVFKNGSYFTSRKEYANGYQNTWASAISTKQNADNPKTYEVYLNITNPFTLQNPEAKNIYLNEFIQGGNSLSYDPYTDWTNDINNLEEIDWTEAEDLKEWLLENHPEYDGLILDEGGDGGYGEAEYRWRGKSFLPFNSNQIKNVDNINPTNNLDIRYSLEKDQRKHYETVKNSPMVDKFGQNISENLLEKDRYIPLKNQKAIDDVDYKLSKNGLNSSLTEFKNKLNSKERLTVNDIAMGERLIQEYSKIGDFKTTTELIQDVAVLGTELGQQVQAMSLINKMLPTGQLQLIEKTINRLNSTEKKLKSEIKISDDIKQEILKADTAEKLDKAVCKATESIAEQLPVSASDKIRSWRYLCMLGNPTTHIRNILSNVAMKGTMGAKNVISGAIEDVVNPSERTKTLKRASTETKNFAKADAEKMQSRLSDGGIEDVMSKVKMNKRDFDNKALNTVSQFNSNMLEKEDWIFLKSAYQSSLANYMTANNLTSEYLSKGTKESNIALEKAREYSINAAQEATFRQYSKLASWINKIENINGATKVVVGGAVPFKKTPVNIAKAGVEYSPIGLFKTLTKNTYDLNKGKISVNKYIDNISKGLTGTALVGIGMALANAGILNASGSDDEKEANYSEELGHQSYSIKIGNSTYTLDWLSPTAMPLFVGAELTNALKKGEGVNLNNLTEAALKTLNPLMDMSMLQSLASALTSYNSDGTAGKLSDIAINVAESYVGQFIPTLSGKIARIVDDTERNTYYSDKTGIERDLERFKNKIIAKIPVASMTLQPKTDIWGEEVKRNSNIAARAFDNLVAPYYKKEIKESKVDTEIQRVYKETNENVLPTIPNGQVTLNKNKYTLTPKEYTEYKKTYGTEAKKRLSEVIKTKEYKQLSDEEKSKIIQSVYTTAKEISKGEYAEAKSIKYDVSKSEAKIQNLVKNGLSLVNSYIYRGEISKIEGTKASNGKTISGSTNGNKAKYIMNMNTDSNQKNKLLSLLNDSEKTKDVTVSDLSKVDKSSYTTFFGLSGTEDSKGYSQRDKYLMLRDMNIKSSELDKYFTEVGNIKSEKDDDGKTITDSKKIKVLNYICDLDIEPLQKITLFAKSGYTDDTEELVFEYLSEKNLTTKRKLEIMSMLYD